MPTPFTDVYEAFFRRITDDEYIIYTKQDTERAAQEILLSAVPHFEFPRKNLMDYEIKTEIVREDLVTKDDFVIGLLWDDLSRNDPDPAVPDCVVERSHFNVDLTSEEINILALLMKQGWVQRQVSSIENTRMKYSGSDFKMTSQANHLSRLLALLNEAQRESLHMQRLYKRRKLNPDGTYSSNWSSLREKRVFR